MNPLKMLFNRDRFMRVMRDRRGFLQALLPFIPSAIALGTSLFGKKQQPQQVQGETQPGVPDYVLGAGEHVSDWMHQYLDNFRPGEAFTGELNAPMTGFENQGMAFLQQFLNQGPSEAFTAGKGELMKTLAGGYDPRTSPFFSGLRDSAMINQQDMVDRINRESAGAGNFYSDARLKSISNDALSRTTSFMNEILGKLFEGERGKMFEAAKLAPEYAAYEENAPLRKSAAATEIGSIPRVIQQASYERNYQEFKRQQEERRLPLEAGVRIATGSSGVRETYTPESTVYPPSSGDRVNSAVQGILRNNPRFFEDILGKIFQPKQQPAYV